MVWHSPLDLYYWFVNVFAGNTIIFLAIAFLMIASLAAMFRMPTVIVGVIFSIFIIMFVALTENLIFLVLTIMGLVIGWYLIGKIK